ncbi:MAG: YdeI family protein [Candidatus Pristimantibacillus sp.]
METTDPVGYIDFNDAADWETWLANHYNQREEAWLRIAKKDSGILSVTIPEALDVALCYGWIDSHRKAFNEAYYLQRYSPRRSKSPWSMVNVRKAEELMETGRMKAPGYAEIQRAQEDGRWGAAYESQKSATIPQDLSAALDEHEQAKQAFNHLDKTSQYAILLPLLKATSAKSRTAQLQKAITKLESIR